MSTVFNNNKKTTSILRILGGPGKPSDQPNSYRPIALTSCVEKLLERIILCRLVHHLETVGALPECYAGFRRGRCTADAIADLVTALEDGKARHRTTGVVLLDISKAFDAVEHNSIVTELKRLGIGGRMLAFIRAFLEGRVAQVSAAGVCSTVRRMTRGVPQGSVLSPLLFSVALAALPQAARIDERTIRPVHMAVYAADIAIWAADRGCCGKSVQKELQRALDNIYHFLTTLGLTLSAAKSVALLNAPHRTYKFTLSLQIAGARIPIVKQATYLGLKLDDRVSWQPAMSTVFNNNKKTTSILRILGGLVLQMHTNQVTPIEQLETLGNFRHSGGVQCANNFSAGSTTYSWGGYDDGWLRRRGAHPTPAAAAAAAVVVSGKNSSVCTAVFARSGAMTDVELKDTNAVSYGTVESSLVRRRKGEPKSVWDDDSSDSEDEANDRDSRRLRLVFRWSDLFLILGYCALAAVALWLSLSRMLPQAEKLRLAFHNTSIAASPSELLLVEAPVILTPNAYCKDIAKNVLGMGGNAVDAAIALSLCSVAASPQSWSLGGGIVILYYNRTSKQANVIDALTAAPKALSTERFHQMQLRGLRGIVSSYSQAEFVVRVVRRPSLLLLPPPPAPLSNVITSGPTLRLL
ncbi:hypothetical protein ISCGN_007690 [Ixodes scapularis]